MNKLFLKISDSEKEAILHMGLHLFNEELSRLNILRIWLWIKEGGAIWRSELSEQICKENDVLFHISG